MIRNRSNLILLLYYTKISYLYNSNTLIGLIKRKYIWFRLYHVLWFIVWKVLFLWISAIHTFKKIYNLIIFNMYYFINYMYFYFYSNNQYLLINTPLFMFFLALNNINIILMYYRSFFIINFLYNRLTYSWLDDSVFNGFILLKLLRLHAVQLSISYLLFFKYDLITGNLLHWANVYQFFQFNILLSDNIVAKSDTSILKSFNVLYNINVSYIVIIYQYIIYLFYYLIMCIILYVFYSKVWSNGSRYLKYIKFFYNLLNFKWFKLRTYLKSRMGINFNGSKLLYSRRRNSCLIKYIKPLNYSMFTQVPSMAVAFIHFGFYYEYTTLFYQSSGLYFTLNLNNKYLFKYLLFNRNLFYPLLFNITYIFYLGFLHVNDLVYFIGDLLTRVIKLVRSFGSYAKIIAIDELTNFFLIKLPSKQRYLFFVLTNVLIYNTSVCSEKFNHQKAGFYQNRTRRSIVRGVAMNPVDHPHGGRTKTIRCPLTPWGLPTK